MAVLLAAMVLLHGHAHYRTDQQVIIGEHDTIVLPQNTFDTHRDGDERCWTWINGRHEFRC